MPNLLTLATELVYLISEQLTHASDLLSLILTCKRTSTILTPRLNKIALEDKDGLNVLIWAAKYGHEPLVRLAIATGHDVNVRDETGTTPLHHAAFYGHAGVVSQLLAHDADINVQDIVNDAPLHRAASGGQLATVRALLEAGGDPNALGFEGNTPLHYAVQTRQESVDMRVLKLLLEKGADYSIINDRCWKAYYYAGGEARKFLARVSGRRELITGNKDFLNDLEGYFQRSDMRRRAASEVVEG